MSASRFRYICEVIDKLVLLQVQYQREISGLSGKVQDKKIKLIRKIGKSIDELLEIKHLWLKN